ncbi:hypothetical protein BCV72DRAFT_330692 [Rhizopus microsporus var. microsporus]|uniref:FAR1 domain-containing protein n=2 Tax=Rhizopus microsporus TaxID=58291 RepID=A0A2G4T769_RHIZD|nr:uncharacterized protein RHIMIDRAFT_232314 [Rhizopus microsporus ATCC 52813]ORE10937.1 hypothetical protein BCV72DRAFT_330692 [Rhizopus microsporus var. microsporus]PHZ16863.1 hypothetical protein RHIMIDRAFT_232314 [Rhizopus microsporus ATCC 52813]
MSESLVLEQYTPFPREIIVDIDSWKNTTENSPVIMQRSAYAIVHNKKKHHLEMKYICHRAGTYKSHAGVQTEDESSKSRPIQKSKKIDCRYYVTVTCYFVTPNQVTVKLHSEHNHLIESLDNISSSPLSDNTKEAILQKLREG